MGTRKKPFYRIVVADQRNSRDGRFIELLGSYDSRQDPPAIKLDQDKARKWLANGAQPSDVVRSILRKQGILEAAAAPAAAQVKSSQGAAKAAPAAESAPEAAVVAEAPEAAVQAPEAVAAEEPQADAAAAEETEVTDAAEQS